MSASEPDGIPYGALLRYLNAEESGELQGHIISQQRSALYPFRYIMATPTATYQHDIILVRNLIIVGVAAILFLGFVLIALAIRMNYKPVKELLQLVTKDAAGYRGNEYSRIRSVFIQTMEDNRAKTLALSNHAATLRNLYFERILKGKEYDGASILECFQDYGVVFPYPLFAVFILYPEDGEAHALYPDKQVLIQEAGLLLQETDIAYIFEMDDLIAGIVNFSDGSPWASASASWLPPLLDNIQENLQVDLVYGQSAVCDSVARLGNAYAEALQVVEYNLLTGGNVRLYPDLGDSAAPVHYYPIEREYYLINCMKTAKFDAFQEVLRELVERNLSNQSLSVNALLCFRMDLINTTIKMYEEVNRIYQQEFLSEGIAEELMKCKSLRLVEQRILKYAQELCAFVGQETKKPATTNLKDRIIAYVQEHYSDPALSNATIAEHLSNNPNYISSVFKAQHGSGINDYINATRIEQAKQLLRETQQTIDSIAARVGYGNARTFIRVFKKREAMTPTQYRELA